MPAGKPSALSKRHNTKKEREARKSNESALLPKTQLTRNPPAELAKHPQAGKTWKRIVGLYFETKGTIITAFDQDVLIKYCLAEEELLELFAMRKQIKELWNTHSKWLKKLNPKNEDLKKYLDALAQANALLQRFQGMDARMDGKRKLIFTLAQSLYLTPRSRAGVSPEEKLPEEPESEMDKLLK